MDRLGIEMPRSRAVESVDAAEAVADELGYPVVIRPAYTMGGTGGGLVYNREELRTVAARGLSASLIHQVLVEESVLGWEELELEVVRDAKNQMITVCFIENVDAMGVHTGDSYCTAPMLTIDPALQQKLQDYAYAIVEAIEVVGGTNVQFAHDPKTGRVVVIEINPRTSRSSALASKATGFPIARVSSLWPGASPWTRFPTGGTAPWKNTLRRATTWSSSSPGGPSRSSRASKTDWGTQMRAVGEAMSIGKTYKEAFQKAIRSLEIGRYGLGFARNFNTLSLDELMTLAGRADQRAAVSDVRGPAQGRRHRPPVRADPHQAVVHPADEGAGGPGGEDPGLQGAGTCPTTCWSRPRRTGLPTATWPGFLAVPEAAVREQRHGIEPGRGLGRRAGQRRRQRRLLLLHLQRAGTPCR